MNAHASSIAVGKPEAPSAAGLTSAIIANIPLLRLLAGSARPESWAAFAAEVGQDKSNFLRTRRRLADDGAIANAEDLQDIALTDLGRRALRAFAAFEGGPAELPAGVAFVKVRDIIPNPDNPRKDWTSEAAVKDDGEFKLAIAGSDGPRQPPVVFPADAAGLHMLQMGERRWRACMANIADGTFPEDKEILVIVNDADEGAAFLAMGEENVQRRNFTYTEEARWFEGMVERFGYTVEEVAARANRSPKHVQDYLRLLKHADVLARLETDADYTLRQARADVAERNNPGLADKRAQKQAEAASPREDEPKLKLTPAQALVFAELADKGARCPAAHMEPGYTRIADMPGGGPCGDLIKLGLAALRNHGAFGAGPGPFGRALLWQSGGEAWLRERGFYEGETKRQQLLIELRHDVGVKTKSFLDPGVYTTPWLNLPEADQVDLEELTGDPPQPQPPVLVQPGLIGDEFSQLMKRAREEADPPPPAPEQGAPEPGSVINGVPAVYFTNIRESNALAVDALKIKVETRLLEWLHGPELAAQRGSWDDTAKRLADYLEAGEVTSAIAILAPHLRTAEGMAATLLDRSLTMLVERHGGRV